MLTRRQFAFAALGVGTLGAATLKQVRLGVTTDEIDEDLLTAIRLLKEFGLGYAEIRNLWGKYNTAQPVEKIREARALLDENGIRVSVLGTGFFKVPLPGEAALEEQWKLLDGAIERAGILGTRTLRIFAFTYKGERPEADYPRVFELVKEAGRRARAKKVRLAIENVQSSYVQTGADAARLLKTVREEGVGLVWDPNNAGAAGERAFPEGYRQLDPARIFHVHLRDYRHNAQGKVEWCAVGEGEFDNLGQIRALLKAGYKDSFTLETHWRSPQGKAHATRRSLAGLLKVIEKV